MNIDFSTLQGLTIPEGVVTKITDASGRVLWALQTNEPIVLEVAKITSDTYAGETTYTGEEFILLDIYPKSGGKVTVTYGGLTKTITDDGTSETPNAQQVFFGTFNGVTDEVETPDSGKLTIRGDCYAFGCSTFSYSSKSNKDCLCITNVIEFGEIEMIPDNAFGDSTYTPAFNATDIEIPEGVVSIGNSAFANCTKLASVILPNSLTSIATYAFYECPLTAITIPKNVTSIHNFSFHSCSKLKIDVDEDNQYYSSDEDGALFNKNKTTLIFHQSASYSYEIPESVTEIGARAFYSSGFGVEIGDQYKVIPNKVASIGDSAFYNCDGLFNVIIPESVTSIGADAFRSCAYLRKVIILATTPPTLGTKAFEPDSLGDVPTITVPAGCGDAYKAATNWSTYADHILEANE